MEITEAALAGLLTTMRPLLDECQRRGLAGRADGASARSPWATQVATAWGLVSQRNHHDRPPSPGRLGAVGPGSGTHDGLLAAAVALTLDHQFVGRSLRRSMADWASRGSAIMASIPAGSRLEVITVEARRWRSTTSS